MAEKQLKIVERLSDNMGIQIAGKDHFCKNL